MKRPCALFDNNDHCVERRPPGPLIHLMPGDYEAFVRIADASEGQDGELLELLSNYTVACRHI